MTDRKSSTTSARIDARTALEEFQDYLAPRLDVYEQAVYLYILRHSRLVVAERARAYHAGTALPATPDSSSFLLSS